eukprot:TRINITY_DN13_c1_g2_i1.p1 TRINITY_DN13_c1_g2~~TRINITY_DN13_c1_g2_i1.p1  ORF type:complete len:153 (-),score=62.16 TRINITY_DN13_c1_g2_i1:56-514(-)
MADEDREEKIRAAQGLCRAARNGNLSYMKRLFKDYGRELDVNWADGLGNTALHYSSQQNQIDAASLLVENGADANKRNLAGDTALHLASRKNHTDMINVLLEAGADKRIQNAKKLSAETEVRSEHARKIIQSALTADELDPDMIADADDFDA